MSRFGRSLLYVGLLVAGVVSAGCAPKPVIILTPKATHNIHYVVTGYVEAEARLGHPPKNAEELKPFLKIFGDPDEVLVSPNDGLPFVVRYGTKVGGVGGFPIVAYEQKGQDGKRYVANTQVRVWQVTDDELARLRLSPSEKAPSDK
jgi:hypothetical protein